jgi:riboflavin kinase / FMN adenylyltransferase
MAPRTVAIGGFDGVHLGHQAVLDGADAAVVLPVAAPRLIDPDRLPPLLEARGVREVVSIGRAEAESWDLRHFVDDLLLAQMGAERVRVGPNLTAGRDGLLTAARLRADSRLATTVVPTPLRFGRPVSTAEVCAAVFAGDVELAAGLLGRPFALTGPVVHGDRRGRTIGFPTANLRPERSLVVPARGVYACRADGRPAAVNVGLRPTFDGTPGLLVEAHILDFEGDLYGHELEVEFIRQLRHEQRFEGIAALVRQIGDDIADVRQTF